MGGTKDPAIAGGVFLRRQEIKGALGGHRGRRVPGAGGGDKENLCLMAFPPP